MAYPRLTAQPLALGAFLSALCSFLWACPQRDLGGERVVPGTTPLSAASASASSSPPAASPSSQAPEPPWRQAVQLERWPEAAQLLDSLSSAQREQAPIRYVRARVALALGDHAQAARLLDNLETQLPQLAQDIALYRAEAQLHAGPVEQAAQFFAQRTGVRELTRAALAWDRAGYAKEARSTVDRALRQVKGKPSDAALDAYRLRARLAEASGDKKQALADLRLVARYGASHEDDDEIEAAIERLDPGNGISASDRLARASQLARRGHADRAIDELERAQSAPGAHPSGTQMLKARAMTLYQSRQYDQAAPLFEKLAHQVPGPAAAEALYYAAKAWSRAQQNDRGLKLYHEIEARYRRSPYAERAYYEAARLLRLQAQWLPAAQGYSDYLKAFPRASLAQEARYDRALCLLLGGKAKEARPLLLELARAESRQPHASSLWHLVAVAAEQSGQRGEAISIWQNLIRTQPLTWPALVASARLEKLSPPAPPMALSAPPQGSEPLSIALPQTAKLLSDLGLDRDAEDALASIEEQTSRDYGQRSAEALCSLYGKLSRARRLFRVAQRSAPASYLSLAPTDGSRWAWDCLFPRPYAQAVEQLESQQNLPFGLLHAVMRQESGFDPDARSPVGARGLMQLMPQTAEKVASEYGVQYRADALQSPGVNLQLGAQYLAKTLSMFHGSVALAAAAYNAGPQAVGLWLRRGASVPLDLWVAQIPYPETRHYVWKVVGNWARYGYLRDGESGVPHLALELPADVQVPDSAY